MLPMKKSTDKIKLKVDADERLNALALFCIRCVLRLCRTTEVKKSEIAVLKAYAALQISQHLFFSVK